MNGWLFVLVNVTVAGLVGGVTNHLAIKMLFHPRKPVVWFGWRFPLTPGLIPKRKQEIAVSLGDVVADYLVTPDGLREMFGSETFRRTAVEQVSAWVKRTFGEQETVGGLLRKWAGEEKADRWLEAVRTRAGDRAGDVWLALWKRGSWGERLVRDAVPGWNDAAVEKAADLAAAWGLAAVRDQLVSADGQALLRKLAVGLMDRTGGFIGMLAGIFVDEDKLVARLTPFLTQQLESPEVRRQVAGIVAGRLLALGDRTLEQALGAVSKEEAPEQYIRGLIRDKLPWADWADKADKFPIGEWMSRREETWHSWLARTVEGALELAGRQAHRLIEAIRLPELVRTQVERFPVERLEEVILSVSGREFRAITWLGVVLGGLIGLVQSLMLLIWK